MLHWFLTGYRQPIYLLVIPVALILLSGAALIYFTGDRGIVYEFISPMQLMGTYMMQALLPAYLIGCLLFLFRQTEELLTAVRPVTDAATWATTQSQLYRLPKGGFLFILIGVLYGIYQNEGIVGGILDGQAFSRVDLGLLVGNAILWSLISIVICWRIPVSFALLRLGRSLQVDLYQLDHLRPLAGLATKDVLVVAGAMVFMPLQSLDAQLRWDNYEAGIVVGVPVAICLFLFPLLGLRTNIQMAKDARIAELSERLHATDRSDISKLEHLSAHIDRVKSINSWLLDIRLMLRVLGYMIIPPLAWVGAALVENLVDQFTG